MKVFNFLMLVMMMSLGAVSANAQSTAKEIKNVNASEFKKLMSEKDVVVLDVRTPREYAAQNIEGATNIPLNTIAKKADTLDKSKKYLVYCRSGARSRRASMILARKGFEVYNLNGGILAWNKR